MRKGLTLLICKTEANLLFHNYYINVYPDYKKYEFAVIVRGDTPQALKDKFKALYKVNVYTKNEWLEYQK